MLNGFKTVANERMSAYAIFSDHVTDAEIIREHSKQPSVITQGLKKMNLMAYAFEYVAITTRYLLAGRLV